MNEVRHLRALQAFDTAATLGSLSKAAETLGVTHGAVSRQIKQLEQYLDVRLLNRLTNGVSKTETGELLHTATQQAFTALQSGIHSVKQEHQQQSVTISLSASLAIKWLVPKLPDFRNRHPNISIFLDTNDDVVDFNDRRIDVALRYGTPGWRNLHHERLTDEDLIVVAAPSLISNRSLPLMPNEIAALPLLYDQFDPGWNRWAELVGLDPACVASMGVQFSNMALLIAAAIDGQGAILARRLLIENDLASGRLLRLDDASVPVERALYFVCRNIDQERPAVLSFRNWLFALNNLED